MSSQMMMMSALFLLILQTNLLFFSVESFCDNNNGNYTLNSTYSNNLDTVLSSIPANIDINGFYNASVGSQNPDIAHAIALCRGDVQPDECRGCMRNLTTRLRTECPNQRQAVEWEDNCMLRYSNETLFGILEMNPAAILFLTSGRNATNPDEFMRNLSDQLDNLRERAANGGALRKVAAAWNVTANDSQEIFALVQCTPDLSSDDCSTCLNTTATAIRRSIYGNTGGRLLFASCNIRYETYSFFNESRLRELEQSVPPSPAPQPSLAPLPPSPAPQPSLAPLLPSPAPQPSLAPLPPSPAPQPPIVPVMPSPVPQTPIVPLPPSTGTTSGNNTTRTMLLFQLLRSCFFCFCLLLVWKEN